MMTFVTLLVRNLLYHWRGNLAVFLGIVLGSAVLTGALLVGDSLRGSLKALTLDQLGWVESALAPGRFFRQDLVTQVSAERRAAALLLQGSATRRTSPLLSERLFKEDVRVGKVTVLGIDAAFWPQDEIPEGAEFWSSDERDVVLNRTLANELGARVGDTVTLQLQKADPIPRESLLGNRKAEDVIEAIDLKVRSVLADVGMARFSLKPTPEPVRNAFVPIRVLQKRLGLTGRANALFVAQAKSTLQADLQQQLTLDDWGLRFRSPTVRAEALVRFLDPNDIDSGHIKKTRWTVRVPEDQALLAEKRGERLLVEQKLIDGEPVKSYWRPRVPEALAERAEKNRKILTRDMIVEYYEDRRDYYVLESQRMLLEAYVVRAVENLDLTKGRDDVVPPWRTRPILIYLADSLSAGKTDAPYSILASDDTPGRSKPYELADDQILLMRWPGSPLQAKEGSDLTVVYYSPDERNHLVKKSVTLKVHSVENVEGTRDDPDLTPEFPGITDQANMKDWVKPPFPYDSKRISKADEAFWERFRTTPKAYVNPKTAEKLWKSRFGDFTSIQVRAGSEGPQFFPKALLAELKPEQGGFVFQGVRDQALQASAGATDFGVLFLAFSFFLIVSALLLVGLLVRLNIDRRAGEMGLLLATGWDHRRVRRLLLGEGTLLAIVGGVIGLGGALLYAHLMLKLLAANWPGGDSLNFLSLHAQPASFAIGYSASLLVSVLTLYLATRVLSKLSPRALLFGETTQTTSLTDTKLGWSRWLIPIGVVGALALVILARFLPSSEAQAGSFFGSGALLLMACLAGVWNGLKWSRRASSPQPSLTRLGMRNASRHAVRSVLTVGLLSAASFLIVAVESFHKETDHHFDLRTGGSGGFAFYVEGNVPVFEDLNQIEVRERLKHPLNIAEMRQVVFYPCRVQAGDDASCLNLYKPLKPRVMGIGNEMVQRGGFHFGKMSAQSPEETTNPWLLLQRPDDDDDDDDAIPAIIDANTAQWILKVSVGQTVEVNNDNGRPVKLRIVALLQESIFQSEILISEANFLKLFPGQAGSTFLLVDAGTTEIEKLRAIETKLSKGMESYNMDVQTTASRLQGYLAVENTYLATFQALGGLGLILGAVGLAIVLLRGVWERRAELALLQALGFRSGQLAWLVLAENAFLLVLGLAAGTVSALLAVAPHLVGAGAQVLWLRIVMLLALVLAVGLLSAALAVWSTLKTPVLTALRRE